MDTNLDTGSDKEVTTNRSLDADFTGEAISLEEAIKLCGKSKVTTLKMIRESKVSVVGKIRKPTRGRPSNLFSRDEFVVAMKNYNERS